MEVTESWLSYLRGSGFLRFGLPLTHQALGLALRVFAPLPRPLRPVLAVPRLLGQLAGDDAYALSRPRLPALFGAFRERRETAVCVQAFLAVLQLFKTDLWW